MFCAHVQSGRVGHSSSCTVGNGFLSWEVKGLGLGVNYPSPCSAEVKERVEI